ncbi:MAG: hypothetical protein H6518_09650 [Microthrixaceae bacterium]|nr:hypothetical protein [Microthrixaceae bacterium]
MNDTVDGVLGGGGGPAPAPPSDPGTGADPRTPRDLDGPAADGTGADGTAADGPAAAAGATGASGRGSGGAGGATRAGTDGARATSGGDPAPADEVGAGPAGALGEAARRDARRFAWPALLALAIGAFLVLQDRADRHERKLADAPLDQGERLRFR